MQVKQLVQWSAAGVGLGAAAYLTYAGVTWCRYGRVASPAAEEVDPLLDQCMPVYDVAERHHVRVAAAAEIVYSATLPR